MGYLKTEALEISAVLIGAFDFAVFAELLGLHFIIGAFMAGLYFGSKIIDTQSYNSVKHAISAMNFGFPDPIFFRVHRLEFKYQRFEWRTTLSRYSDLGRILR